MCNELHLAPVYKILQPDTVLRKVQVTHLSCTLCLNIICHGHIPWAGQGQFHHGEKVRNMRYGGTLRWKMCEWQICTHDTYWEVWSIRGLGAVVVRFPYLIFSSQAGTLSWCRCSWSRSWLDTGAVDLGLGAVAGAVEVQTKDRAGWRHAAASSGGGLAQLGRAMIYL